MKQAEQDQTGRTGTITALSKYQRLECSGLWRASGNDQRQNVFVSLGDATLVIRDSADVALAHWSLPAVIRLNPGETPALFSPAADAEEVLELDDDTMIDAIQTVQRAVVRSRPKPGRLRRAILLTSAAAIVALGLFWLPKALVGHTAEILPTATRADIGLRLLVALEPLTGRPCTTPAGKKSLMRLQDRLFGDAPWAIAVLPGGPAEAAALPGGVLLARKSLIEPLAGPDALAGALLVEAVRAKANDPMIDLLSHVGLWETVHVLTSGQISDEAIRAYAEKALVLNAQPTPIDEAVAEFAEIGLSTRPYAATLHALDPVADTLRAADPAPGGPTTPLLSDANWIRLQAICE